MRCLEAVSRHILKCLGVSLVLTPCLGLALALGPGPNSLPCRCLERLRILNKFRVNTFNCLVLSTYLPINTCYIFNSVITDNSICAHQINCLGPRNAQEWKWRQPPMTHLCGLEEAWRNGR